ncbi:MAG: hypothetical protein KJ645_11580 [Planctomycetes bacterium]|nr:hypothetical protein [Planctomycetota bacterium]
MSDKILLIAPRFYEYIPLAADAAREVCRCGADILYESEPPNFRSFIVRKTFGAGYANRRASESLEKKISKLDRDAYRAILVLRGRFMTPHCIAILRRRFRDARCILYSWDSLRNNKNLLNTYHLYDRAFTFDLDDSAAVPGLVLVHQPYWLPKRVLAASFPPPVFDLYSCAAFHRDRLTTIRKVTGLLRSQGLTLYNHLYIERFKFYHYKYFKRLPMSRAEFKFSPLPMEEHLRKTQSARAVLDLCSRRQTGATMRMMDALALKKKVITTNPLVKSMPFYQKENIRFIDKNDPEIDESFIRSGFQAMAGFLEKYSLQTWIRTLLD